MVEYTFNLDFVFGALADPTRRDILAQVSRRELSVGEIAKAYNLTFAAVSKHLKVLENANLISKRRRGKEQIIRLTPKTLAEADEFIRQYHALWEERLDALEEIIKKGI